MRIKTLLVTILICVVCASAQDVITKTDGSTIKAKVEEITETTVKYHRHDNPSGPMYSIPVSSIIKIAYENGVIDSFENGQIETPSAESRTGNTHTELNEVELLRIAGQLEGKKSLYPIDYLKKAKAYRLTGWIGGGVMFLTGAVLPIFLGLEDNNDFAYYYTVVGAPIAGAGAIWCLSWNLAANRQKRLAKTAFGYSIPVIEHEIFSSNGKSLAATFNMMGNNAVGNHNMGLGLGLKLNF